MRNARGGLLTASVGLLVVGACSGASSTNLLGPPLPGSGDDASNSVGRDATLDDSSRSEASTEDVPSPIDDVTTGDDTRAQGDDGRAADHADASSDGPPADGSLVSDGVADVASDASAGDGGDDSSVQDARFDAPGDAADTFPCGPTRTCNRATEYCFVLNVVAILDSAAGPNYSCQPLPGCD